ncbi:uncharacterized protein LOC105432032 [Pogonomyrmex barbatus]|uniref:Uncharacterized protein LOC105432032 n=1 Tax=Pogonomyrmex barbatus TaxID=144034 RepID=A0A6I9WP87_9HYME|nr:uncharacterized protein LOC105432032 [Pogonomyrmex barbatus]
MSKEDSSSDTKPQDASSPDTPTDVPSKNANADIYENRGPKKIIRVVTVMAYLFSVSFVGILLSAYYIFLWEPPNPRLIQRERLRSDPQLQFLIAPSPSHEDPTKDSDPLQQSEVAHVYKPLLSRMTHEMGDNDDLVVDPRDKMSIEKKRRVNAMLLKLRRSLVVRAQNRNLSQEAMTSDRFNNSSVEGEEALNSTKTRSRARSALLHSGSRRDIPEGKFHRDNIDLPSEHIHNSSRALDSKDSISKFLVIVGTKVGQTHDGGIDANPMPVTKEKNRHQKKLNVIKSYPVRGFMRINTTTNGDVTNRSIFESHKTAQESPKIDTFDKRKELMKQNAICDHQLDNNDRENDSGNAQTDASSQERADANVKSSENYSSDKFSKDKIAHDRIMIDSSSRDPNNGFTDDPGFHQTDDEPTTINSQPHVTGTRNSEETQIEKMTARSTTLDNKQVEQMDSITQQKSFSEIFTDIAIEDTSVEFTSISTMQEYHDNFTSITNKGDESVT